MPLLSKKRRRSLSINHIARKLTIRFGCFRKHRYTMSATLPIHDGGDDSIVNRYDGEYDSIVHRPNYASRPTILTGDNAQDSSYTPSPPFGPLESMSLSPVTSFFRSSTTSSHLNSPASTAPTSFFSSGDSRAKGTSPHPTTSSGINTGNHQLHYTLQSVAKTNSSRHDF